MLNDFLQSFLTLATVGMYFFVHEENFQDKDTNKTIRFIELILMVFVTVDAIKNFI